MIIPRSTRRLVALALVLSSGTAVSALEYRHPFAGLTQAQALSPVTPPVIESTFDLMLPAAPGLTAQGGYRIINTNDRSINLGGVTGAALLDSSTCGAVLAAGEDCTLTYSWTPSGPNLYESAAFQLSWAAAGATGVLSENTSIRSSEYARLSLWPYPDVGYLADDGRTVHFSTAGGAWTAGASLVRDGASDLGSQSTGAWYYEVTSPTGGIPGIWFGVNDASNVQFVALSSNGQTGSAAQWGLFNGATWTTLALPAYQANDVIGVGLNPVTGTVSYWHRPSGGSSCTFVATVTLPPGALHPYVRRVTRAHPVSVSINTGQAPFACSPSGYAPGFW